MIEIIKKKNFETHFWKKNGQIIFGVEMDRRGRGYTSSEELKVAC